LGGGTMEEGGDFAGWPEAARILKERFAEIFEDYNSRLREMNSLLVVGDGTTPSNSRSTPAPFWNGRRGCSGVRRGACSRWRRRSTAT
jgi:hypothetical protein